jgi:hypothetical protein
VAASITCNAISLRMRSFSSTYLRDFAFGRWRAVLVTDSTHGTRSSSVGSMDRKISTGVFGIGGGGGGDCGVRGAAPGLGPWLRRLLGGVPRGVAPDAPSASPGCRGAGSRYTPSSISRSGLRICHALFSSFIAFSNSAAKGSRLGCCSRFRWSGCRSLRTRWLKRFLHHARQAPRGALKTSTPRQLEDELARAAQRRGVSRRLFQQSLPFVRLERTVQQELQLLCSLLELRWRSWRWNVLLPRRW